MTGRRAAAGGVSMVKTMFFAMRSYSILRLRLSPTAGKARLLQSRGPCYASLHKARAFCRIDNFNDKML
jgi:hypothetical protein